MVKQLAQRGRVPAVERRPVVNVVQRSAAAAAAPIRSARPGAVHRAASTASRPAQTPVSIAVASPVSLQAARVSQPNDPAEREATQTARKVMQMGAPANMAAPRVEREEETKRKEQVQRAAAQSTAPPVKQEDERKPAVQRSATATASAPAPALPIAVGGGAPLSPGLRSFMEPRFGADFGGVRVHTGTAAAEQSATFSAHAFTVGAHVFFGRNQYQPESASGRELIAHELTHTIQQGAAVQRSAAPPVAERTGHDVQRWGMGDALDYIADQANAIPGFRMLTVVLGMNPVNCAAVDRSGANLLRAMLEMIPITGALIVQALERYGILARVGGWMEAQVRTLGLVGSALKHALTKFLDSLSWTDVLRPSDVWERAKHIFTEPIDRLVAFARSLVGDILGFIREAILLPLARLAANTRGYDLLKAVLGEDPVTGERVAPTPEAFLGGFLKLIGQDEIWENVQKAKALPRVWAWFQGAVAGLKGFVAQIPALFVTALKSLEITDLILPLKAFAKVAGVFGNFVGQFVSWGLNAAWILLEIVFDVVSPGALQYIKKTGAALKGILKNPIPFVKNLVNAALLGFNLFKGNFLEHLKAGLIDWLLGALPGVYIPKAFTLIEIGKFALSVLGLTWANIRSKLVRTLGEPAVKLLEAGFDIVVALVRDGPAAAWDVIKDQLGNLQDMVIGAITGFIVDMVVQKAIPKLIAMFIPGLGFVSAILSIYDTVMVFVRKLSAIGQLVKGFVDSIVAIASGQIAPAAQRIESSLAGVLSLAINFLAGFAGLGKVADKIMGVFAKIRAPFDKAIDWLVSWIEKGAKSLLAKGKAVVGKLFNWAMADRPFKDDTGATHTVKVDASGPRPRLVVESTPMAAREFLEAFIKGKDPANPKIPICRAAISEAETVVSQLDAEDKKSPKNEAEVAKLQQALLMKNTAVADALRQLVGEGKLSLELKDMYLLEGLTGTYGSMPKPKGDNFTADHQPQAAVLQAAAALQFGSGTLFDKAGNLATRAEGRAKEGFAINLHKSRHAAGATYGGKGAATKKGFLDSVSAGLKSVKDKDKKTQRTIVIEAIRVDMLRDVSKMKEVVQPKSAFWKDLDKVDQKDRDEVIATVSQRIVKGEDQIAHQDIESLID